MAILERPDFWTTWELDPDVRIVRAVSVSGDVRLFDPPVGPDDIQLEHDSDFTTVEIETVD
ncbi:MAG: hypothetical protein V4530_05960 [Pseudomonadota bacterium]